MAEDSAATRHFEPTSLRSLDEPVQRYLCHALAPGTLVARGMQLAMVGRIRVGRWLAFDAVQEMVRVGHAFTWTARAGLGPFRPLHVVDRYSPDPGSTEGRLLGRWRFMHAGDRDTARAAAGRAAVESVMDPTSLLPDNGVTWQAERDDLIVARFDVPPEPAEVRLQIHSTGALRSVGIMRWGNVGQDSFGYIPFGGDVHAERRPRAPERAHDRPVVRHTALRAVLQSHYRGRPGLVLTGPSGCSSVVASARPDEQEGRLRGSTGPGALNPRLSLPGGSERA